MECFAKYSKIVEKCLKIFNNSRIVIKGALLLKQIITMAKPVIWVRV